MQRAVPEIESNKSEDNGSDLWNWGNAPLGSKIVDGNLVTDPYYLRPLLNLSSNWLGETYTDSDTGLPMETYSDPLTGKKIYRFLNPTTSKPFFTYSTYPDAKTGNLVYAYVDPMTGKEVYASTAGKPHKTKSRRRLSTSLRWPFLADLFPRNVCDLTHKGILPAALFQVIKGIHNCSDPIR